MNVSACFFIFFEVDDFLIYTFFRKQRVYSFPLLFNKENEIS